ncbi:MAG: hypothetical protein P0111_13870 [Nitrospira sp.]|nr:hypothetical protein [Nitrospira sp.]
MPNLTNAARRVPKATYVPLKLPEQAHSTSDSSDNQSHSAATAAVIKFGYLRQLNLQPGEVDEALSSMSEQDRPQNVPHNTTAVGGLAENLRRFEGAPMPALLPSPSALASVSISTLTTFGNAVIAGRQNALAAPQQTNAVSTRLTLRPASVVAPAVAANLLQKAVTATKNFQANAAAVRIGMLNLERLEMTPAGLERGELVSTICLAPMEETSVIQKEWSVTNKEFTSIVTDSLEDYSETGVTENTELAQSTTSQATRNNQFNATGNVQGSFGNFVTASGSTGFSIQDQTSRSATDSRKDALAVTRKASSRVKQSHKVTISTSTTSGASETSTRILKNPSATDPMRIDYFSLMRKWHVGLYRYGLRLTYDIVIPEPGAAMRKIHAQMWELQQKVNQVFSFPLTFGQITPDIPTWQRLSEQFNVQLPPPPNPSPPPLQLTQAAGGLPPAGDDNRDWHEYSLPFDVPPGYWITGVEVHASLETSHEDSYNRHDFAVADTGYLCTKDIRDYVLNFATSSFTPPSESPLVTDSFLLHATGSQVVSFHFRLVSPATVGLVVQLEPTPEAIQQWQSTVWNACYNAAQTNYYAQLQAWNAQIAALQAQIANVDTLTLRREENDEIMKCVLRWLLGEGFDFMPADVAALFKTNPDPTDPVGNMLKYGVAFTGNDSNLSPTAWSTVSQYEQMVRFINDAVEWENVVYFLYSYFWDVPGSWEFIRAIRHPDLTRQGFLRSGSARVVLTIREGYEEAWVKFAEGGAVDAVYSGPYLAIAQQIADYNNTNYPGIPPTTPGGAPLPDDGPQVATVTTDRLSQNSSPVTIAVSTSAGFVAGYTAIIDNYDSGVQEVQPIVSVPDSTHIVVQAMANAHDGSQKPVSIMQAGEKGLLIAEWFEYTPSSGTDIAVTSNLATIA